MHVVETLNPACQQKQTETTSQRPFYHHNIVGESELLPVVLPSYRKNLYINPRNGTALQYISFDPSLIYTFHVRATVCLSTLVVAIGKLIQVLCLYPVVQVGGLSNRR